MIQAEYDIIKGPWVSGYVFLPSARLTIEVRFLIDTGTGITSVSLADLVQPDGKPISNLPLRPAGSPMLGIGGTIDNWSFLDVGIAFEHQGGGLTEFALPVAVVSTPGIPSLLGRDILALGSMNYGGIAAP